MAELIWTEPALSDLEAIADYISFDNPAAAKKLVRRIFEHVEQLRAHPESRSKPPEIRKLPYRQIVEPPCRIFYRYERDRVLVLHVLRGEKLLRRTSLTSRDKENRD